MRLSEVLKNSIEAGKNGIKAKSEELIAVLGVRNIMRSAIALSLLGASCGQAEDRKASATEVQPANEIMLDSVGFVNWGGAQLGKQEAFVQYSFDKPVSKIVITKDESGEKIFQIDTPAVNSDLVTVRFDLDEPVKKNAVYTAETYDKDGKVLPACYEITADVPCINVLSKKFGVMEKK